MYFPVVALTVALFVSLVTTPLARRFAVRIGLIDHPDTHRKLHKEPIALCGGIAVLVSLIISVALMIGIRSDFAAASFSNMRETLALAIASIAIVNLGVIDDRFGMRGRQKLLGQVLICCSLMIMGFTLPKLSLFGWEIELGLLAIPVTLGWLLLTVNSINLIDGADGLCSTVGWIACAALSATAWITGNYIESMVAAAMAGALLGFLFFNLPPAKVFLGDAGSMLVGLVLGVLTMRCTSKSGDALPVLIPVCLMAIPFFDSSMAIIRRKLTGRSVFTVDRGHLHHNLIRLGIKNGSLVGAVTVLALVTSTGAVLSVAFSNEIFAIISMCLSLGLLVATRAFGFAELELLSKKGVSFIASLISRHGVGDSNVRVQKVRLQGSREWELVWTTLVEFAEKHGMSKVSLDLNMPWLHEGFHANWHVNKMPEIAERWMVRLPIESDGRILGRLEMVGKHQSTETYEIMSYLADVLSDLQPSIVAVVNDFETVQNDAIPSFSLVKFRPEPIINNNIPSLKAE
jgi:UDP-GlcNAc:undecaprenyl-phosphate GlcNAc-1-phosphate transferase